MTKYQYLLAKKESGELSILLRIGLPVQILRQMDIYASHLAHPEASQLRLSLEQNASQATVHRAIAFMRQELD
ncbi:MAG: hypothetical protein J5808_00145 [Paludibacteraceae bacterium]|nr:hypothetical protein [Paludibacteraceae bacterium]